jgi:hypothetical protein
MPRYTTTGIPQHLAAGQNLGLSAFMPHFNRLAASGAQAYKGGVTGRPGTAGIAVDPMQQNVPSPDLGDIAQMGLSRSSDAPDMFWPNQYYDQPTIVGGKDGNDRFYPGAGMPIQVYDPVRPQDTTMVPVPATDLRSVYQAHSAKLAGGISSQRNKALKQPATFVRWARRQVGNGSDQ